MPCCSKSRIINGLLEQSQTEQNGASSADYSGVPASVTFNTGDTSKTFDFAATDDTYSDTGESVKLTFGALPDRVSEGTPAETTVTIRQVSAQFQLDCSQAEWCADLQLDDYTAVDWGWSQLQYNGNFSPPANLSVKSFIFRGVEYTIRAVYVVPGIYPEIDNAYNRVQRGQGEFLMSISHGETWEAAPEGHYQDWELHIGGVPFGEAALWGKRWFLWYGLEFQEIFTDWTSSTVNKIGIRAIPSVQHLPTVPPAPAYVSAAAQDSDGLRVSWRSPWTRQRNQAITGYIVQWKQASHSWSDSPRVSSMAVGPKSISRAGERPDRGRALHGARHRDQRRGRRPAVGGRHRQAAAPDAASGLRGGQRPDADNALQPAAGHELGSRGERIHGDRRPGTPRGELGVDFGDRCHPDPRPGRDVHR